MLKKGSHGSSAENILPIIDAANERCFDKYGLTPANIRKANVLTSTELKSHKNPLDDLLFEATIEMRNIYTRLRQYDYLITLTDDNGVTLKSLVPHALEEGARGFQLYDGSIWTEDQQGTNGVGTALAIQRAVTVMKAEHFAEKYDGLTCTTAPIFDSQKNLAAILNVTTPRNTTRQEQAITRQMVSHAAKRIENMWFMNRYHDYSLLQVAKANSFADIASGELIALDNTGKFIASTLPVDSILNPAMHKSQKKSDFISNILSSSVEQLNAAIRNREPLKIANSENTLFYFHTRDASSLVLGGQRKTKAKASVTKDFRQDENPTLEELVGRNAKLQRNMAIAQKAFEAGLPILLNGATGSGKGAFAKALHLESSRAKKPFVPINCAAIPETLFESVLFGYKAGAFTGADSQGSQGSILDADGGTLFLDEIGDMPINLQTRLLRVLSEREVTPIGSSKPISINVNIISATLHNLDARMDEGAFRDDLFFRIGSVKLEIPSLAKRDDKEEVIAKTLLRVCQNMKSSLTLAPDVLDILISHHWKGNIRELLNVLKYAAVIDIDGVIDKEDLPDYLTEIAD